MKPISLVLNNLLSQLLKHFFRHPERYVLFLLLIYRVSFPQSLAGQHSQAGFTGSPVLWNTQRISGNFGELRGNHFHSGVDYKTNEIEGLPVLAAADGFISRVKISAGGYGRALYITHPGNVVTVYGHLRMLCIAIEDSVKKLQHSAKMSEIEFFPDSGVFKVKRGELVGFSGNSGSSEGPHLHFETRHRNSERPFNPELAGYNIADTTAPIIKALVIYKPGPYAGLSGSSNQIIEFEDFKSGNENDTIITGDSIFTGFEAIDRAGREDNIVGVRWYELYLDDSLVFSARIDSFSFDETRMIQAMLDYKLYRETGRKIILCYVLKGNKLPFYLVNHGLITIQDEKVHTIKIRTGDTAGNRSEKSCFIRKHKNYGAVPVKTDGELCVYGKGKTFKSKNFKVEISPFSLYEDVWLRVDEQQYSGQKIKPFSPVISIGPVEIPVNQVLSATIKFKAPKAIDRTKLIVVKIDAVENGEKIPAIYKKGTLNFNIRSMGEYVVTLDTMAPVASGTVWEPDSFTGRNKLIIQIKDDPSGIKSYHCLINENWVVANYNAKRNSIIIYPEDLPVANLPLKVEIELQDTSGNRSIRQFMVSE